MLLLGLAWGMPECGLPEVLELEARGQAPSLGPVGPPPPPGADETCFGPRGAFQYTTEHFSLEWDEESLEEVVVTTMAEWLEEAWAAQVDELGWAAPTGSEDWLILARLDPDTGRSYVYWESCGGQSLPYATFYVGSSDMHPTVHHEFAHLSQHGSSSRWGSWWWEATATWMQVVQLPDQADVADQVVQIGFLDNANLAMHSNDRDTWEQDAHLYGMAVLAWYLEEQIGPGTVLETWSLQGTQDMPSAIEDLGLDWDEVYRDWVLAVVANDFSRGEIWGPIGGTGVLDLYAYASMEVGSLGLGVIRFHPEAPAPSGSHLNLNVDVDKGDWLLWLVVDGEPMELEDGEDFLLEDSQDFDSIVLVMSPLEGLQRSFDLDWEAWSSGEATSGGYTSAFPEDEGCQGCSSGPVAGWLALLLAATLRRR